MASSQNSKLQIIESRDYKMEFPRRIEAEIFWDNQSKEFDNLGLKMRRLCVVGARELDRHLKEYAPKNAKIADMGAGTGLVGQILREVYGYTNLTAFDISKSMLDEAKKKGIYNHFVICDLNDGDLTEFDQQYDHLICIGCFVQGVVKPSGIEKVSKMVKPGGFVCLSFREANFNMKEGGYREGVEELERRGVWKEKSRVLDEYFNSGPDSNFNKIKGYYITLQIC